MVGDIDAVLAVDGHAGRAGDAGILEVGDPAVEIAHGDHAEVGAHDGGETSEVEQAVRAHGHGDGADEAVLDAEHLLPIVSEIAYPGGFGADEINDKKLIGEVGTGGAEDDGAWAAQIVDDFYE